MSSITYSYVIPVYNEEDALPYLEKALSDFLKTPEMIGRTEVVLVDDGSTDRSWAMIADLASRDNRFVAVRLSRNFGHQFALTAGYAFSRGEAIISLDADLQDPLDVSTRLIDKWKEGYDVVYAIRSSRKGETLFKKLTASLFYKLIKALGESAAPKNCGDFRLMSRRALDAFNRLPEHHRYVRGLVGWIGFNTTTIEYERQARVAGKTKFPIGKMTRFALDAIVSMSSAPLRFSYIAAVFGTVIFAGYLLITFYKAVFLGAKMVPGWSSLIISVIAFGALNLICLGLIGEYVGRIYQEAKRRPLYLVSDVIRDARDEAEPRKNNEE